jgi:hypothetical protein
VTEAELLEALRAASAPTVEDDPGLTRAEMATLMGHSENWVSLRVLKPLAKSNRLIVGHRRGLRTDGVACVLPVYRVA